MMAVVVLKTSIFEPKATGFVEQENTSLFFHFLSHSQGDCGLIFITKSRMFAHAELGWLRHHLIVT